jgi:hypothetical protein
MSQAEERRWTIYRGVGHSDSYVRGPTTQGPEEVVPASSLAAERKLVARQRCSCWVHDERRLGWTGDDPCPVHPDDGPSDVPPDAKRDRVARAERAAADYFDAFQDEKRRRESAERERDEARNLWEEGWAWASDALDALGLETVFDILDGKVTAIRERADRAAHLERALREIAKQDAIGVPLDHHQHIARATLTQHPESHGCEQHDVPNQECPDCFVASEVFTQHPEGEGQRCSCDPLPEPVDERCPIHGLAQHPEGGEDG